MPKPPVYLGEVTGDNMQVTPEQLLEMVRRDLEANPGTGLMIQVLRQEEGNPRTTIDRYRARVPYHVEVSAVAQYLHDLLARD